MHAGHHRGRKWTYDYGLAQGYNICLAPAVFFPILPSLLFPPSSFSLLRHTSIHPSSILLLTLLPSLLLDFVPFLPLSLPPSFLSNDKDHLLRPWKFCTQIIIQEVNDGIIYSCSGLYQVFSVHCLPSLTGKEMNNTNTHFSVFVLHGRELNIMVTAWKENSGMMWSSPRLYHQFSSHYLILLTK